MGNGRDFPTGNFCSGPEHHGRMGLQRARTDPEHQYNYISQFDTDYEQGIINPTSISWLPPKTLWLYNSTVCVFATGCTASGGIRHVSFIWDSQGNPALVYNLFLHWTPNFTDGETCSGGGLNDAQIL